MTGRDKPLVWLSGEVKTPPFSKEARVEAGHLLRRPQQGERLGMPHARAMPGVGPRCYEVRVRDSGQSWRIMVRVDEDAIVIADVLGKKSRTTPKKALKASRDRLRRHDEAAME